MILGDRSNNDKEILREQFELISANIKSILQKKKDKISSYERQFLLNAIKKVKFMSQSFDIHTSKFSQLLRGVGLQIHQKNANVFEKGDPGNHFYIILEGVCCVEIDNIKEGKKEKQIYYYPGDSFGQVSLIYDVPRGTRIVADQKCALLTIEKNIFNECGDLKKNILYLNSYFSTHPYFEKEEHFMIRVVSSISKFTKFAKDEVLVDEGNFFNEILFFVKGQVKVYRTIQLQNQKGRFSQTIQLDTLVESDVFGEYFYTNKIPSTVRIISTSKGQMIKVNFKDDVHTVQNALYKRIRQNAQRFPTAQQLLNQYKIYLDQKYRQLQYINKVYKNDENKKRETMEAKKKLNRIINAKIYE